MSETSTHNEASPPDDTARDQDQFDKFLIARGGAFYELQRQLGLLRETAFQAGRRAVLFIAIAWGVPLILCILAGHAIGPSVERPYLTDPAPLTRFFLAIGLFMLMERAVEERLRAHLAHFVRAPILSPASFDEGAQAVTRALKRRDALPAEGVCLFLAIVASALSIVAMFGAERSSWAALITDDGVRLTLAAWWCGLISNVIFWFLMLRWLWRHVVWALLLRDLANLDLRLVATHPDGYGGLAFVGRYPNAYAIFVLAISSVIAAAVANHLIHDSLSLPSYGFIMGGWLIIVLALFAIPLGAFRKPLVALKENTMMTCSAQATRHRQAVERALLGRNICPTTDTDKVEDIPDPSDEYEAAKRLGTNVFSRARLVPVAGAALLPLVVAGTTVLPFQEILGVAKRLLLL